MKRSRFTPQKPLSWLHLAGWTIYVLGDYADHVLGYGVYYAVPSVGSGLAAYLLTGFVAVVANAMQSWRMAFKAPIFITLLYLCSIVWHKIWTAMHTDAEEQIIVALRKIPGLSFEEWIGTGYVPLLLFLSWAALYLGGKMFLARQEQASDLNAALLEAKKAQLHTLRYQLNPHFLFNSLNSVDVSVLAGDKDTAHQMIKHLTSFLRRSLEQGEQDKILFEHELALVRDFVTIEELRFGDAIELDFDVSEESNKTLVPPMLLQPLVENALKYAWTQTNKGHVVLRAMVESGFLKVEIVNDKFDGTQEMVGTGTGLRNTRERLDLLYGEDAAIVTENLDTHFKVQLTIPREVGI